MKKIQALTSLRFIAAAVVFLHHFMCRHGHTHFGLPIFDYEDNVLAALLFEGRVGVTLFFVLSGFLLLIRYYDSIFTKTPFRIYWLKRFARIFPLYWFLLIIMFVYYKYMGWGLDNFPIFITLTQGFFSDLKFSGIGVAWSLTVEECFYIMLPFLILGLRFFWKEHTFSWKRMGIAVAGLVGVYFLMIDLGDLIQDNVDWKYGGFMKRNEDIRIYTIFGRFGDFAIGMIAGLVYLKTKNRALEKGWLSDLAIVIGTLGVAAVCLAIYYKGGYAPASNNLEREAGWEMNSLNALFCSIVIYFCCSEKSWIAKGLSWRPFVYAGEISFAFYLLHFNNISFRLYSFAHEMQWNFITSVTFIYLVITIASIFCYEVVERPCQHLILEKAGVMRDTIRRPTMLRLIGMNPYKNEEKSKEYREQRAMKKLGEPKKA